ncbi:MAG: VanW family protein [Bacilli bacterium]|nr:VanW family protein [Bacilli bacterium]
MRKLFCELNPTCYKISLKKERFKRRLKNTFSHQKIAKEKSDKELKYIIKGHFSIIVRKLYGVDIELQKNKVTNIELACKKINGLIIHPNEVFSFWTTIGSPTKRKGYKEGLVIRKNKVLDKSYGGGLCQMANMIHYLVLNSPLEVVELHHHTDALFPDERRRVPFGTGTSVMYNYVDYRFKNNLDFDIQLLTWVEDGMVYGELRAAKDIPYRYKLVEEDHHFKKEGDKYYRISKVYKITINKKKNKEIKKELILNNHSLVLYDYKLIPKEEIRND